MSLRRPRLWLAIGWLMLLAVVAASLLPPPQGGDTAGQLDKLGHLGAYGSLMLWFGQLAARGGARVRWALGLALLGVALEFAQGETGYRSFELADMAANCAGIALGAALLATPLGRAVARLDALT